jgi:predicted nucleotidyltransferase
MRLSNNEIAAIKSAAQAAFGPAVSIWLFGSRTDDAKRGGDIDLLVMAASDEERLSMMRRETDFRMALTDSLGEQRVDIVFATSESMKTDPFLKTLSAVIPLT